uniref:Uncharacterized protein n=1 Tax=Brassica oleracea var. oleracea TaxID=109376 RepID=A0A0D3DK31_BRAOL
MVSSDHRPVVAYLDNKIQKRRGQFRFDKRWIGQDGLLDSIERGWGTPATENTGVFVSKIINCRHEISTWRKIIHHMGRKKSVRCNRCWKKFKMIIAELKRIFWMSRGNCRKRIKTRKNIGNRKAVICGIHQEI